MLSWLLYFFEFIFFFYFKVSFLIITLRFYFYFYLLFLVPKFFDLLIKIYKNKFLYFYSFDVILSTVVFLWVINHNLEIVFPVIGVVYNRILFDDEEEEE